MFISILKTLYSFIYWVFKWDWQTIANISVPITLVGTIWYWHHEIKLRFIVRIRTLIKAVKKGVDFYSPGLEVNVINSSSEIMFIELMGVSKKINIVTKFYFWILKHIGNNKRKFYSFKSDIEKLLESNNDDSLIKLESGCNHTYKIIGENYIDAVTNLVIDSRKLTSRMKRNKPIKFFISIKVYDKKVWDTTFDLSPNDKTYTDVKKATKIIEEKPSIMI